MLADMGTKGDAYFEVITADIPSCNWMIDESEKDYEFANNSGMVWAEVEKKISDPELKKSLSKIVSIYEELMRAEYDFQRKLIVRIDKQASFE